MNNHQHLHHQSLKLKNQKLTFQVFHLLTSHHNITLIDTTQNQITSLGLIHNFLENQLNQSLVMIQLTFQVFHLLTSHHNITLIDTTQNQITSPGLIHNFL